MRKLQGLGVVLCVCLAVALVQPALADVAPSKYRLEPVATGLTDPSGMAAAPDGRIFYLEKSTGNVRVIQDGKLLAAPFVTLAVSTVGEEGLLGIALHPEFTSNGFVYLYYTQASPRTNRVIRYTADGNTGTNPLVIVDDLGYGTSFGEENGGGMAFGMDGFLYVAVGVMENDANAQEGSSFQGKVLKVASDGSTAEVYGSGLRNPMDLAVNPSNGLIYAPDDYDLDASCDELNAIGSGGNAGWNVEACSGGTYDPPVHAFDPQIAATGVAAFTTSNYPVPDVCTTGDKEDCSFIGVCANDGTRPCQFGMVCDDDPQKRCKSDSDCTGTCIAECDGGAFCVKPCGGDCTPSTADTVFVSGNGNGKIFRDLVSGAGGDVLDATSQYYFPSGSECPVGLTDLEMGQDGWLYVVADDPDSGQKGIYRLIYDPTFGTGAGPREVSGSLHMPMTLGKSGNGIQFWWEDLKKDVSTCSEIGTCSVSGRDCVTTSGCPGGETCDNPACPTGTESTGYTLWKGTIGSWSSHASWVETDGTVYNDALLTHTETDMPDPGADLYFLASARSANYEGGTGTDSDGNPRSGYGTTDLCGAVGYGSANNDAGLCTGEVDIIHDGGVNPCNFEGNLYPDQDGNLWSMEDFRGKTVVLSFMQFG